MGMRFRKSFKVAPGVKINLNKKSSSVTFGGKGAHYTINSNGRKTRSVGIPGTGISYSETTSSKRRVSHASSASFDSNIDYSENINEDFKEILTPKEFRRYSDDTKKGFIYDEDPKSIITPNGKANKVLTYKISAFVSLIGFILLFLFALAGFTVSIPSGVSFLVFSIILFLPYICYRPMIRIHKKIFAWKNSGK